MVENFARRPEQSFEELIRDRIQNRTATGLVVTNKDGPKATIRLYDVIGLFGVSAEEVAATLDEITADEIEVQISSPGGDVFAGIAIYNAIRAHPAKITTRVDSMAASIASVIAQAGDHRVMLTGSQMMIHEAQGLAIGNASVMRELAGILDKETGIIAGIYAERADGDRDRFLEQMEAETWFTHDEAVEAGLADEVVKPSKQPVDSAPKKFSDQLRAVITAVEQVTDETENVITFRSEQGKPPLSEDAVALLDQAKAALSRLADVAQPEPEPQDDRLAALKARAEARQAQLAEAAERLERLA